MTDTKKLPQSILWSDQAVSDFNSLFSDANYSDQFKNRVAVALLIGWGGHKDQVFWITTRLYWFLSNSHHTSQAFNNPLSLLMGGSEIWRSLIQSQQDGCSEISSRASGGITIQVFDSGIHLSKAQLLIASKVIEFVFSADNFRYFEKLQKLFEQAQTAKSNDNLATLAREVAKIWYFYRKEHFSEGALANQLKLASHCLGTPRKFLTLDDPAFELWLHSDNDQIKTFKTCLKVSEAYYKAIDRQSNQEFSIDEDKGDKADLVARVTFEMWDRKDQHSLGDENQSNFLDTIDGLEEECEIALLKKRDYEFLRELSPIIETTGFLATSNIRSLAVAPVQAKIINDFRRDKVLQVGEAYLANMDWEDYKKAIERLEKIDSRLIDWMEYSAALNMPDRMNDETVVSSIIFKLKKERMRSLEKPQAEIAAILLAATDDLLTLKSQVATTLKVMTKSLGSQDLALEKDLPLFKDRLMELYAHDAQA